MRQQLRNIIIDNRQQTTDNKLHPREIKSPRHQDAKSPSLIKRLEIILIRKFNSQ